MVSRQELKKSLEEHLNASRYFMRVHVEGSLDSEWSSLYIEYQKSRKINEREFTRANQALQKKFELIIYQHFYTGIVGEYEGPNDNGEYRAVFGRKTSEIMGEDSTEKFLEKANEQFRNKYWFESQS